MKYQKLKDVLEEIVRECEYQWQLHELEEFIEETIDRCVEEMIVRE